MIQQQNQNLPQKVVNKIELETIHVKEKQVKSEQELYRPRAESARAVTGRRCPHSGEGEDFLTRQPGFFFLRKRL